MTESEQKLIERLKGMVESYEIAMDILKVNPIASGVVYGAFIHEIIPVKKLLKELEGV